MQPYVDQDGEHTAEIPYLLQVSRKTRSKLVNQFAACPANHRQCFEYNNVTTGSLSRVSVIFIPHTEVHAYSGHAYRLKLSTKTLRSRHLQKDLRISTKNRKIYVRRRGFNIYEPQSEGFKITLIPCAGSAG